MSSKSIKTTLLEAITQTTSRPWPDPSPLPHGHETIKPSAEAEQQTIELKAYTPSEVNYIYDLLSSFLPTEIASQIVELAGIWTCTFSHLSNGCQRPIAFTNDIVPVILTQSVVGPVEHPVRGIVVETISKDQGWSSYRADYGTHRNSWTRFFLTLERSDKNASEWKEIVRRDLWPNVHACGSKWITHAIDIKSDEEIVRAAKRGDRFCLWAEARFPGWKMIIQDCRVCVVTAAHTDAGVADLCVEHA
jgi:hypothetical protein